jgi:hypothetical protein
MSSLTVRCYSKLPDQSISQPIDDVIQFNAIASQFINLVLDESKEVGTSLSVVSKEITSLAIEDDLTWPFHTIPFFDHFSHFSHAITVMEGQAFVPLITLQQRKEWEAYSAKNQIWMDELLSLSDHYHPGNSDFSEEIHSENESTYSTQIQRHENYTHGALIRQEDLHTFDLTGAVDTPTFMYAPIWQHLPFTSSLVNFDMFTVPEFKQAYEALWNNNIPAVFSSAIFPSITSYGTTGDTGPLTQILQGVYSKFIPQKNNTIVDQTNLVAIFSSTLSWMDFFSGILLSETESSLGLILVLVDPDGRNFTYRFDGTVVCILYKFDLFLFIFVRLFCSIS